MGDGRGELIQEGFLIESNLRPADSRPVEDAIDDLPLGSEPFVGIGAAMKLIRAKNYSAIFGISKD
jgi:hypothetical protein